MDNKQQKIFKFVQLGALILYAVLPFLKLYHYVAMLPGEDSEGNFIIGRFDHYYSAYENITDLFVSEAFAITLISLLEILVAVSFFFKIKDIVKEERKGKALFIASCVATGLIMFVALFGAKVY